MTGLSASLTAPWPANARESASVPGFNIGTTLVSYATLRHSILEMRLEADRCCELISR
jgi:hypothetical protein